MSPSHPPCVAINNCESKDQFSQNLWDREYEQAPTIPSSLRAAPAHALVALMQACPITATHALDLGCGNGRNSLFLARLGMHVTALDFCKKAMALTHERVEAAGLSRSVELINHDLLNGIPAANESLDLVLDAYSLCHFTLDQNQQYLMGEIARVLKPGGYFIKVHVDSSDAYYLERRHVLTSYGHISLDPANGLKKMHCSVETYTEQVASCFALVKSVNLIFSDDVRGETYERSIFACLMQKVQEAI